MSLSSPIPITEFTPREQPDPYDFAALDVLSHPAWRFEKGVHYDRTEDHLRKWARRYADANGLTMGAHTVKDPSSNKVIAIEIAFRGGGGAPVEGDTSEGSRV